MTTSRQLHPVPDEILAIVRPVVADLVAFGGQVADLFSAEVNSVDISSTRVTIVEILDRHERVVGGCGVVMAPGALADQDRFLEWWWRPRPDADPEPLRANIDLTSPDTFDYTAAAWYRDPASRNAPTITGPYLDVACSNEYVLTMSCPVSVDGQVVAIAAADVPLQRLEPRAMPILLDLGRPAILVNEDGRVVLSTDPQVLPAQRLDVAPDRPGWGLLLS